MISYAEEAGLWYTKTVWCVFFSRDLCRRWRCVLLPHVCLINIFFTLLGCCIGGFVLNTTLKNRNSFWCCDLDVVWLKESREWEWTGSIRLTDRVGLGQLNKRWAQPVDTLSKVCWLEKLRLNYKVHSWRSLVNVPSNNEWISELEKLF